jgi:ABC-type uncharacterized transport system substrate-binding protein
MSSWRRTHQPNSTPIVFTAASDPVASGFVASLARPGANVTGLSFLTPELAGKHLELLKQVQHVRDTARRVGTLSGILGDVAAHLRSARHALVERRFGP